MLEHLAIFGFFETPKPLSLSDILFWVAVTSPVWGIILAVLYDRTSKAAEYKRLTSQMTQKEKLQFDKDLYLGRSKSSSNSNDDDDDD